jgi:hypothetical protein
MVGMAQQIVSVPVQGVEVHRAGKVVPGVGISARAQLDESYFSIETAEVRIRIDGQESAVGLHSLVDVPLPEFRVGEIAVDFNRERGQDDRLAEQGRRLSGSPFEMEAETLTIERGGAPFALHLRKHILSPPPERERGCHAHDDEGAPYFSHLKRAVRPVG